MIRSDRVPDDDQPRNKEPMAPGFTSSIRSERIRAAYDQIPGVFRNTPQFVCPRISHFAGCQVLLKIECLNAVRSFKGRGASVFLQQQPESATLVTASAGNFGQALAYAARAKG